MLVEYSKMGSIKKKCGKFADWFNIQYFFVEKFEQPVMFYWKISSRSFILQTNSTVVFETVILHMDGHNDQYDWMFAAPKRGVYMFSCTVSIWSSNYVVTDLVVEDKTIFTAGNTDLASIPAFSRMNKDEHAIIRTANYGNTHIVLQQN